MPDNRQEPSQALMRMVAAEGPWANLLTPIAKTRAVIGAHADYYGWQKPLSVRIEIWQTTYVHAQNGVSAGFDRIRGSALGSFRDPRDDRDCEQFFERYMRGLSDTYPVEPDGSGLPLYPRLFVMARKRDATT